MYRVAIFVHYDKNNRIEDVEIRQLLMKFVRIK